MKKLMSLILAAMLVLSFAACASPADPINITALKGPTGMGMAMLMQEEYAGDYSITLSSAPDEVTAAFISGDTDIAAVPINLASVLYNKLEGDVVLLAVNTLGVLYVLEAGDTVNSLADLAGKTLYATGQGSTPEYILNYLLEANGMTDQVTVEYYTEHSELATLMAAGDVTLGMLPEPNVSAVLVKNDAVHVALDLTEEWNSVSDTALVQGCIIAKRSYYEANTAAVESFLTDYAASAEYVNTNVDEAATLMETYGILASAAIAKQAIPKCNIVCMQGEDAQAAASGMLKVLFNANPKSVGGALPGDDFYIAGN